MDDLDVFGFQGGTRFQLSLRLRIMDVSTAMEFLP
jgi:hypothetical protein